MHFCNIIEFFLKKKSNRDKKKKVFSLFKLQITLAQLCNVTTPLLEEREDDIHTLETRTWVSQRHFWKSVRMTLTLPKWGLGSPSRLSKFQSSIAGVKTPRLEAFFMSLEIY